MARHPVPAVVVVTVSLLAAVARAGSCDDFVQVDQTPDAPLARPLPPSYAPRHISGFGSGSAFTVFFEDCSAGQAIPFVGTTWTGRTWASVGNDTDHHFHVADDLADWTLVPTFQIPNSAELGTAGGALRPPLPPRRPLLPPFP